MNTDKVTTIIGFVLAILLSAKEAIAGFNGEKINWLVVAGSVLVAALGYWTNKPTKPTV